MQRDGYKDKLPNLNRMGRGERTSRGWKSRRQQKHWVEVPVIWKDCVGVPDRKSSKDNGE